MFAQVKVQGGKLLQLEKTGNGYKITGDFFCYPETAIEELEHALTENNRDDITKIFSENDIIGFGADDLFALYDQVNA